VDLGSGMKKIRIRDPVWTSRIRNTCESLAYSYYNSPSGVCQAVPVRCEICSLTVSCQKTYETHISGKAHKKRIVQASHVIKLSLDITEKNNFSFVFVYFLKGNKSFLVILVLTKLCLRIFRKIRTHFLWIPKNNRASHKVVDPIRTGPQFGWVHESESDLQTRS
jgi:hypothetical protein